MNSKYFLCMLMLIASLSIADDTEIYINSSSDTTVRPNILFIMDTSGSMNDPAPVAQQPYDASTTYSGNYNSNRYYTETRPNRYSQTTLLCNDLADEIEQSGSGSRTGSVIEVNSRFIFFWIFEGYDCDDGNYNGSARRLVPSLTIWDGNYLNYLTNPPTASNQSRIEAARAAFTTVINSLNGVNVGLMHFGPFITADDDPDGGTIDVPISPVEDVRESLISSVNAFRPYGGTPLAESVYESMLYFSGSDVRYGYDSHSGVFTDDSRTQYQSPITHACQSNHVILFTDGVATVDEKTDVEIRQLLSQVEADIPDDLSTSCRHQYDRQDGLLNTCLEELAFSLKNSNFSDFDDPQEITLHIVGGFDVNQTEFLQRTGSLGGGGYQAANSTTQIVKSLKGAVDKALAVNTTFTAPAVSVNAFNASEHRDEVFYAVFRPNEKPNWLGNIKKYRLNEDGIVIDANGAPAINTVDGFFQADAKDFWNTDEPDGGDVELGGFANLLDANSRNVFSENRPGPLQPLENVATKALYHLEAETDENFNKIVQWSKGFDVGDSNNITRFAVGDPLHSEPLVITYGGSGTENPGDNPDATLFFGTNEGFLHALNANTGQEQFAYLPSLLMQHQPIFYNESGSASNRPYGMDGYLSAWINDINENNVVYSNEGALEEGEHIYLYAGMRRGGRNYYALDVTDRSAPQLKFIIEGGTGQFEKLGQTWSKAVVAKIKLRGTEKIVLIFGGGYDENQDTTTVRTDDGIGNAIYIVDAETGQRLWWASSRDADLNIRDMKNSIPATPTPVDINSDGFVDYLIAVDTGGRVIRIDFNNAAENLESFASGGIIADLSGAEDYNNRRFYNQPSVSLINDKQFGDYLTIAVGSGYRAKPVSSTAVNNRMYVIRDRSPFKKPNRYIRLTEAPENYTGSGLTPENSVDASKLFNATSLMTGGTAVLTPQLYRLMTEGSGFYVTLDTDGEKVLSRATTFSGAVLFTTFSPNGETEGACGPDVGRSKLYVIDQKLGIPVLDLNGDGQVDENDASKSLSRPGIAPRPVVIYRSGGEKSIAVDTEIIDDHRFDPESRVVNRMKSDENMPDCSYKNCNVKPIYWRVNDRHFSYDNQ